MARCLALLVAAASAMVAAQNSTMSQTQSTTSGPYPLGAHTAWSCVEIKFGRLTLSTRCCCHNCVCSIASRFHAIDATNLITANYRWREGSSQYRRVRDELQNWQKRDITECFSGSSNYQKTTVFCDRQCIQEVGRHNIDEHYKCAGPWYCSKSASSQEYNKDLFSVKRALSYRRAIDSYSCATLEQCFPTPQQSASANVQPADLPSGAGGNSYARTAHFGGVRVETSCCANGRHYNHLVDQPCNGAAARGGVVVAAVVSLGSLLFLL